MKLNYKRTYFVGLAFLSICAFWQMYDSIIPLILQNTFGLDETVTGIVMSADNVLALFLLPLIGSLSDKVDTKLGKRTPFIIGGTIAAIISMLLLPYADSTENLILFVVALGVTLVAMAMYRSPAVALMPDVTPKPLRSKANAVINLMGAVGGVYALVLISTSVNSGERPSYLYVFVGIALIMILSVIILVFTTKEKLIAEQIAKEYPEETKKEQFLESRSLDSKVQRSLNLILISIFLWFMAYNAVTTAFSRYATEVWGLTGGSFADCLMVATVAAILSYIPIGILSSKYGRKKCILLGIILMFASYIFAFSLSEYHAIINVGFAVIGIGWAAISVNSLPMVVEMSKGSDIGKYTGLYYTFSMAAQIATPILSGVLLQYISYRTLFPYAATFMAIAFVTMYLVKHGDSIPERKESLLENFDVED
ncbi:MAG: MFS transporter [Eubacteriales bacterium]